MDSIELILNVHRRDLETAEAIALSVADGGIYTEDYSELEDEVQKIAHIDLIDEDLLSKDRDRCIIHIYMDAKENPDSLRAHILELTERAGISCEICTDTVREEDWATCWRRFYTPFPVGERLYILPSWLEPDADATRGRQIIRLDPGAAFGTGSHETTRLCLTLLEKHCHSGVHMLDIGCGSGILAIGCAKLEIESAVGVDIDGVAVRVAKENAEENGVSDRVEFVEGDLAEQISGKFELVAANIVSDVIIRLLDTLLTLMTDDGVAVFSGIIDTREAEVAAAIEKAGLHITRILREKGWTAIEATCNIR